MVDTLAVRQLISNYSRNELSKMPSGASSRFVALNDDIGVKVFYHRDSRDNAYDRQAMVAEYGFAPDVYGKIYIPACEDSWGFFTERVITPRELWEDYDWLRNAYVSDENMEKYGIVGWNGRYSSFYECEAVSEMRANVEPLCGYFHDIKPDNVGFKNGVMVPVDFGLESWDW